MESKLKYYIPTRINLAESSYFRLLLLFAVILFSTTIIADGDSPPFLTIINNSVTNDTSVYKIFLNNLQSITFNVNTTDDTNTWNWYLDNTLQTNPLPYFTVAFSSGSYHYVSVNATNASGTSNNITWGINVYPPMATSPQAISLLNETPAKDLMNAIQQKSFVNFIVAPTKIYTNLMGLGFYTFVWFIVFSMLWLKQQSINIPSVVGVIFGGVLVTFLPPQYQLISQVLIVFGIFAVIYVFFKGRG